MLTTAQQLDRTKDTELLATLRRWLNDSPASRPYRLEPGIMNDEWHIRFTGLDDSIGNAWPAWEPIKFIGTELDVLNHIHDHAANHPY